MKKEFRVTKNKLIKIFYDGILARTLFYSKLQYKGLLEDGFKQVL